MRCAPQSGFSPAIRMISSRSSTANRGRPHKERRLFQAQYRFQDCRCQPTTVAGCTISRADRQRSQERDSSIQIRRSTVVSRGRALLLWVNDELLTKGGVLKKEVDAGGERMAEIGAQDDDESKHGASLAAD